MLVYGTYFYDLVNSFQKYTHVKDRSYLTTFVLVLVVPIFVLVILGVINYFRSNGKKANAKIKKSRNYADAMALCRNGEAYFAKQMYDKAIRSAQKAVEIEPRFAHAYKILGKSYRQIGRVQDALVNIEHSLALEPKQDELLVEAGWCYLQIEMYDRAKTYFSRALSINRHYDDAYFYLGQILGDVYMDYDGAIRNLEQYLRLVPLSKKAHEAKKLIGNFKRKRN